MRTHNVGTEGEDNHTCETHHEISRRITRSYRPSINIMSAMPEDISTGTNKVQNLVEKSAVDLSKETDINALERGHTNKPNHVVAQPSMPSTSTGRGGSDSSLTAPRNDLRSSHSDSQSVCYSEKQNIDKIGGKNPNGPGSGKTDYETGNGGGSDSNQVSSGGEGDGAADVQKINSDVKKRKRSDEGRKWRESSGESADEVDKLPPKKVRKRIDYSDNSNDEKHEPEEEKKKIHKRKVPKSSEDEKHEPPIKKKTNKKKKLRTSTDDETEIEKAKTRKTKTKKTPKKTKEDTSSDDHISPKDSKKKKKDKKKKKPLKSPRKRRQETSEKEKPKKKKKIHVSDVSELSSEEPLDSDSSDEDSTPTKRRKTKSKKSKKIELRKTKSKKTDTKRKRDKQRKKMKSKENLQHKGKGKGKSGKKGKRTTKAVSSDESAVEDQPVPQSNDMKLAQLHAYRENQIVEKVVRGVIANITENIKVTEVAPQIRRRMILVDTTSMVVVHVYIPIFTYRRGDTIAITGGKMKSGCLTVYNNSQVHISNPMNVSVGTINKAMRAIVNPINGYTSIKKLMSLEADPEKLYSTNGLVIEVKPQQTVTTKKGPAVTREIKMRDDGVTMVASLWGLSSYKEITRGQNIYVQDSTIVVKYLHGGNTIRNGHLDNVFLGNPKLVNAEITIVSLSLDKENLDGHSFNVQVMINGVEEPRFIKRSTLTNGLPDYAKDYDMHSVANLLPITGEAAIMGVDITKLNIENYTPYKASRATKDRGPSPIFIDNSSDSSADSASSSSSSSSSSDDDDDDDDDSSSSASSTTTSDSD